MENQNQKLKVRLNLEQPKAEALAVNETDQYQYHWKRIGLAALLAASGLYAVIAALRSSPADNVKPLAAAQPAVEHVQASSQVTTGASSSNAVVDNSDRVSASEDSSTTISATPKSSEPVSVNVAASNPAVGAKVESQSSAAQAKVSASVETPLQFLNDTSSIISSNVERFQFAKGVDNYEPVGAFSDIESDSKNIARVYAFSEISNMQGEKLTYRWLHDGKTVADVNVTPSHNNKWRSHSSKLILPSKTGTWQLWLMREDGTALAQGEFTVE